MEHHFNVYLASEIGVEEAIFIHNLYFWIKKNEANNKHFYDGYYWTYNSAKAFSELFPYWTPKQIIRIIKSCIEKGYVIKGEYNKSKYDRTSWYAITEKVETIYRNSLVDVPKRSSHSAKTVKPIPDSKTDNKQISFFKGNEKEKKEEILFDEDSFKTDPENGKLISDYDRTLKEFDTLAELKTILNDKQEYENIRQICFIRGIDNDYTIKCLFFYFASLLPEDKKNRRLVDTRSHFKRWIPKQVEIHTLKGLCETAEKAYKSYVEIIQKQDIIEAIYRIVNENKENGRHPLHGIHNEAYKYTRDIYDRYNKEYGLIYAYYDKLIQQKREQEQNQNND